MIVDDPLHDREAEAGAALATGGEQLEQARVDLRRDAGAVVLDVDDELVAFLVDDDAQFAAIRHRLDRVARQIVEHAQQLLLVEERDAVVASLDEKSIPRPAIAALSWVVRSSVNLLM